MVSGLYIALSVAIGGIACFCWFVSRLIRNLNEDSAFHSTTATFENPIGLEPIPCPSIGDSPSKMLTIVIPAYNEEQRLPITLDETFSYLQGRQQKEGSRFTYEIIVVDDGSRDGTVRCAVGYARKQGVDVLRVLRLPYNRGKGFAVKSGALVARGAAVLVMDADGATRMADLELLEGALKKLLVQGKEADSTMGHRNERPAGLVLGSRAHLEEKSKAKRTWLRTLLMHGFHFLVGLVVGHEIRDTQCGFKLANREAARLLFPNQRLQRWCFDVELVRLAQALKIPVAEVQVTWTEIPGSKLRVISIISMALELFLIKVGYGLGLWPVRGPLDRIKE